MTITSPNNDQLKEIRKLAGRKWRDKTRQFVAEGEDLLEAAAAAGWTPQAQLVAEGSGLPGDEVKPHLMAQVSQLGSGTRALAIYGQRWVPEPVGPLCLALWGVNDPGNVGTVLRGALAFGAASVALGPGTADPYGPKAVRASMGALFSVPVARVREPGELPGRTVALVARDGHAAGRGRGGGRHARRRRRARGPSAQGRRRLRRGRAHPDRVRVPERGDGGNDRVVRARP